MKNSEVSPKIYRLGAKGFEEIDNVPELPLYSRVYAFGFAMCDFLYAVISERDANGMQKLVKMSKNYEGDYFSAFQTIDKFSSPISKKFGIGFYWDDQNPEFRFSESDVKKAIEEGNEFNAEQARKKELADNADRKEIEELPAIYPYLTPAQDKNTTTKNIREMLKQNFPNVKFSVKKESYDTVYIRWTDGPTSEMVERVTDLFEDHCSDWSGDYRDYSPSNFNKVFGGYNFVFCSRSQSEKTEQIFKTWAEKMYSENRRFNSCDANNLAYQLFAHCQIYDSFEIVETEIDCGLNSPEVFFTTKEVKNEQNTEENNGSDWWINELLQPQSDIQVIDYSDLSIAVIGNTKRLKDELKAMGGRFNFRLSCGAGWIFPKTKKDHILAII